MIRTELLLGIFNAIGVFALLSLAYGLVLKKIENVHLRQVATGILFGGGGLIAVANATEVVPGVRIDVRAAILVLAGPFGGVIAAIEAATITAIARYAQGGVAMPAGILNIVATAMIGCLFISRRAGLPEAVSLKRQLLIGVLCNVPMVFIFTIPIDNTLELFLSVVGPVSAGSLLAVLILTYILNNAVRDCRRRDELETQATVDPLTGLLNRRGFERKLKPVFNRLQRSPQNTATVLVIDIDHFKRVNDGYGHDAGDAVLVKVASIVTSQVRHTDLVARFGGEELVVAMPRLTDEEAHCVAERLRNAVAEAGMLRDRGHPGLTISIGVTTQSVAALDFQAMFKLADSALYRAKANGRNRVEYALAA